MCGSCSEVSLCYLQVPDGKSVQRFWSWHGFTTSGLSGAGETVLFGEGTEICRGVKLRQQYPSLAEGNKNSAER